MFCIEYPGSVQNPDAMLDTLGGKNCLFKAFDDPSRRLELRFRPEDIFSKPTCSERNSTTSLLVKVTRYKKKESKCKCKCTKHNSAHNSGGKGKEHSQKEDPNCLEHKLKTKVLGSAKITYSFPNMSDFQYLATEIVPQNNQGVKNGSTIEQSIDSVQEISSQNGINVIHRPIMEEVYYGEKMLPGADWLTGDGSASAPLFLPPAAYTRMDQPQDYHYRKDTSTQAIKSNLSVPQTIIGRTRQRRTLHAVFVNYETPKVPERPSEVALHQLKVKFIDEMMLKEVNDAFQAQPVWTKTGLSAVTGQSLERLKFMLPTLAYYFTSGPWRNQWVRFGYDPRNDPSAAIYQTLDYRVRLEGGAKLQVRAKRSYANYILPYQSTNPSKSRTSTIIREALVGSDQNTSITDQIVSLTEEEKSIKRSNYMFERGVIPPCRQMFYQYKDIKIKEAEDLVKSKSKKFKTSSDTILTCDERNGWFEAGLDAALREVMTKSITHSLTTKLKNSGDFTNNAKANNDGLSENSPLKRTNDPVHGIKKHDNEKEDN